MKKLMIAALAVASCTVYGATKPDAKLDNMSKDAVYNLTLTTKYLDYATKAGPTISVKEGEDYSLDKGGTDAGVLKNKLIGLKPSVEAAQEACRTKFSVKTNELQKTLGIPLVVSDYKETVKTYAIYGIDEVTKKATVVANIPVVTKITFKYQDESKPTKVVSKNLNGVVIVDGGKTTSYIWDNATKDFVGENIFAGSKKGKPVQLATASRSACKGFQFGQANVAKDLNTDGGFHWISGALSATSDSDGTVAMGWGTGKVKLNATQNNEKYVINSLAGNFAGVSKFGGVMANGEYGTWKLSYDDASTKILLCRSEKEGGYKGKGAVPTRKYDDTVFSDKNGVVYPETYEEILGKKKVEIID